MMTKQEYMNWAKTTIALEWTANDADDRSKRMIDREAARLVNEHTAKYRELVAYLKSRSER